MEWTVRGGFSGKMTSELRPKVRRKQLHKDQRSDGKSMAGAYVNPWGGKAGRVGASENEWGCSTSSRGKWPMTGLER